ncbi:gliding motility-associated C-terminal domain-containing protein [Mucilaginibacter sp. AW1-3]
MKTIFTRASLCLIVIILFGVKVSAVSITSFTPRIGVPGTLITITGTDLSNPTSFSIGGKPAIIISNTGTKLVGMIMPGARSGNITIINAHGSAVSATNFMLVVTPDPGGSQGTKLTGRDTAGAAAQGVSVAYSSTGYTSIVGGNTDSAKIGAAWVYASGGTQQGTKLVGTNAIGQSAQGTSVAISADGNTAIVGGPGDNNSQGAVWVFTRTNTTWTQQGPKLTITTANPVKLGISVSLSADGNTFVAEASGDNNGAGGAYVFVRNNGIWSRQGGMLAATGSAAGAPDEQRVAISADGNTFIMGAHTSTAGTGSAWIFTRNNGTWLQQAAPLFGTGSISSPNQGSSVALSADGNIAAVGGFTDNNQTGAVWIFKNDTTAHVWKQMGYKIVSVDTIGKAKQGCSVSLNADGTVLLFGGLTNDSNTGLARLYIRRDSIWTPFPVPLSFVDAVKGSYAGNSVALSADGINSIVGGFGHDAGHGIAWLAGGIGGSGGSGGSPCALPGVNTAAATAITSDGATLNGSVSAVNTLPTSVVFEFATLSDMSNSVVAEPNTGTTPLLGNSSFSAVLNKQLKPATTYYFRIVAANYCTEITYGNIMQFTTPADAPGSGLSVQTIPTAFSPNNDGINDKWDIPFLSKYPNCSVKIFNRGGQVVFASTGYTTSWDGRFKNSDLPSGAYFYIIDLKNNQNSISGAVNLVK